MDDIIYMTNDVLDLLVVKRCCGSPPRNKMVEYLTDWVMGTSNHAADDGIKCLTRYELEPFTCRANPMSVQISGNRIHVICYGINQVHNPNIQMQKRTKSLITSMHRGRGVCGGVVRLCLCVSTCTCVYVFLCVCVCFAGTWTRPVWRRWCLCWQGCLSSQRRETVLN